MPLKFPAVVEIKDRFENDGAYWRVICKEQEEIDLLYTIAQDKGLRAVIYHASPASIVIDWMNQL